MTLVGSILKESKSTESRRLAELDSSTANVRKTGEKSGGQARAPMVILIDAKVPAVLVEVGFISNPQEGKKLTTKAYQRQLATSIAKGIEQYINKPPTGSCKSIVNKATHGADSRCSSVTSYSALNASMGDSRAALIAG